MSSSKKIDLQRDFAAGVYQSFQTGDTVGHVGIFDPNFISLSEIFQIHFGSGAARIQNDFFCIWIILKVSDPTGSRPTTLVARTEVKKSHYI
jgi:hypothetical protein